MKIPVLLPNIFDHPFTYECKKTDTLKPGNYVRVPFGSKELTGIVWDYEEQNTKNIKIKKISKKINIPPMKLNMIKFISWFSKYNITPLGMILKMTLIKKDIVEKIDIKELNKYKIKKISNKFKLNGQQTSSLKFLEKNGNKYNVCVLEGVTGSGKTLVYFERIKKIIKKDVQALIMLPEIALSNQFNDRFKDFFGFEPAIWNSKTSIKNKKIIWKGLTENKIKIVIGTRSSLFLPFKKLGIIVIDEEHDASYKQDEGVSYNARDMAITRASIENIPIYLVTAVPSVETYNNIINKKYKSTFLSKRYKEASLPKFEVVNLNSNELTKGKWIAKRTIEEVKKHLSKGNQILFFLNRRGYAPFVVCKNCNKKFQCPNCSINLIFHKSINKLLCHHCGYKSLISRKCKNNISCDILMCGPGVERIFSELKEIFIGKKIEIFSSDSVQKKISTRNFIKDIEQKKIDIIVGTQLISKGFHFPKLNCIIVVDADFSSHGYDLRSAEKNIQLYHQLSGRAGRSGEEATIYFQTFTPKDETLLNISKNNPHLFLKKELELRKEKKLPPFYKLISLTISGDNIDKINKFALSLKSKFPQLRDVDILGPVDTPIYKLKKRFRCRMLVRYPKNLFIQKYFSKPIKDIKIPFGIKLGVDVDPINFS
jgi:primosomal protein N' (replication factor Y)